MARPFFCALMTLVSLTFTSFAQSSGASRDGIYSALAGEWTGTLAYRDFQSNEHVLLPAWLKIKPSADGRVLEFAYTYDDGPTKTITEKSNVAIDESVRSFMMTSDRDKSVERYQIEVNGQKGKRINLTLTGIGRENNQAVDVRITVKIDRNLYQFTKETRGQGQQFEFRDGYAFTRNHP